MVVKAVFDGETFRPTGPLPAGLKPGDEVDIRTPADPPQGAGEPKLGEPGSADRYLLWASQQMGDVDLPADYSVNWEKYLREEGR